MYFEISQDLITNLSEENFENLNNIIDSYKYGNHILAFENRSLVNTLNDFFYDNEENKRIINHIYSNHQDNQSLKNILNTYVRVTSPKSEFSEYYTNNKQIFDVPLNYFDEQLLRSTLITENTSDGIFYKGLMNRIQSDGLFDTPKNVLFNCTNDSGGGSQIAPVFNNKINIEKRLAFSICDSDKKAPESSFGDTPKALIKTYEQLIKRGKICSIFILNVREKENLIPPSYYLKHNNFKNKLGLSELSKLENDNILYEKLKHLKISATCEQTLGFLNEDLSLSMDHSDYTIGKNGLDLISKEFIYTENYLQTIGATSTRDENQNYSEQYISFFNELPEYLYEEYKSISHIFLDWSCAYPKPRIAN